MENCKLDILQKWKMNKTQVKVYCKSGTMLEGTIIDYCDDSFILDKVLVFYNGCTSIKPAKG
jgi:sRNA-binding regulator protein Hfq